MITESYDNRILDRYYGDDPVKLKEAKLRLENHEPLAYIIGEQAFYGEMYFVDESVLIPRFDTERVVDRILEYLPENGSLADLCSGSGNIGISSLCHSHETSALLVDISDKATELEKTNALRNGVHGRCSFVTCDLHKLTLESESFDVIASNPPYIKTDVIASLEEECRHEPYIAFDGGIDGMDFYRLIVSRFATALKKDGKFIFEIGFDQKEDIIRTAAENGFECEVFKDYGGNDRVAVLKRKEQI